MNSREHPRIQIPFEVEVTHPSLGYVRSIARDISEGGLFVTLDTNKVRVGSKVKVTVVSSALSEGVPTPTIDMEVVRLEQDGAGLKFSNRTSRHLWDSVERLRGELAVGRDYFQIFQGALIVNRQRKLLVVQQHGKWLFPGTYLVVGEKWQDALGEFLSAELDIQGARFRETLAIDSGSEVVATETALLSLFHRFTSDVTRAKLGNGKRYTKAKWVGRTMEIDELTFTHPLLRELGLRALEHAESEIDDLPPGQRLPRVI